MIRIPYLDLKAVNAEVQAKLDQAYARVLDSGWFILGRKSELLRRRLRLMWG